MHARLWDDHRRVLLDQLKGTGMLTPTMVGLSGQATEAYWQWAQTFLASLVIVTTTVPPWSWIAVAPAAVANVKYPAERVVQRCPGHPYKGPYLICSARWVRCRPSSTRP